MDLFIELPMTWQLTSSPLLCPSPLFFPFPLRLQTDRHRQTDAPNGSHAFFLNLTLKLLYLHFYHILLITQTNLGSVWGELHMGVVPMPGVETGIIGGGYLGG